MVSDKKHDVWLKFVRNILDVPVGLSKQDLQDFLARARSQHPALVDIMGDYIRLAERSDTDAVSRQRVPRQSKSRKMHLFDLLREKAFFPQNLDLARFAERVVPNMRSYRFDKMSRSDIAARVIEYIEGTDQRTRDALEESMREALAAMSMRPAKEVERQSFLSKWERIIKGLDS